MRRTEPVLNFEAHFRAAFVLSALLSNICIIICFCVYVFGCYSIPCYLAPCFHNDFIFCFEDGFIVNFACVCSSVLSLSPSDNPHNYLPKSLVTEIRAHQSIFRNKNIIDFKMLKSLFPSVIITKIKILKYFFYPILKIK